MGRAFLDLEFAIKFLGDDGLPETVLVQLFGMKQMSPGVSRGPWPRPRH